MSKSKLRPRKPIEDMTLREISEYAERRFNKTHCISQCRKCGSATYEHCVVGRGGVILRCSDCEGNGQIH